MNEARSACSKVYNYLMLCQECKMRKFSEVLDEYLSEREAQNSDYYNDRFIGERYAGQRLMQELASELDEMVHGVSEK